MFLKKVHTRSLFAFIACCIFASCENDVNDVIELGRKKPSIEEGKNIDAYLSMNGKVSGRLTAPVLIRFQGDSAKKSQFPNTLHVDFYNDSLKVESQVSANYGEYRENDNKIYLRDKVVVFNTKGDSLFTDELYWDKVSERFYTDKKAILSLGFRSSVFIALDGLNCSQDLKDRKLFRIQNGSYATIPDSTLSDKPAQPVMVPFTAVKK